MKGEEVRAMTPDELTDKLAGLQKEVFNLRFQKASGQLENTARVRQVRRDIARIKTVLAALGLAVNAALEGLTILGAFW